MKRKFLQAFLLMLTVGFLGGCAKPEPPMRVLWPPLPDTPRLEWLGVYYSEADMPRTRRQEVLDEFMGNRGQEFFGRPFGVAADGQGLVYVSDADQRVIKVFDFNTHKLEAFAGGRRFQDPLGLAVDRQGNLYVAEGRSKRVLVFSSAGKPLFSFGGPDILERPVSLAINENLGRIYVSDGAGHKIEVFDLAGEHLFSFGEWGGGDGHLYSPQGLAVDAEHRLFVADQFNARIQVFDADGNFLHKFGERGNRQWNFEFPKDLAFDSDGNLHILDVRKAALITYRPDGTFLLYTGAGISSSPVAFGMPMNIWIDGQDRIYITDSLNRRMANWRYFSEEYLANNPFDEKTVKQQVELREKKLGNLPKR